MQAYKAEMNGCGHWNMSPQWSLCECSGSSRPFLCHCWLRGKLPKVSAAACSLRAPVPGTVLGPELLFHPGVLAAAGQMRMACLVTPHRMAWRLRRLMREY